MTHYSDLFHWLGADAETVWLEWLNRAGVPTIDLTDPQADE